MITRIRYRSRPAHDAFTLVEVLIVITILGILAATLLPTIPSIKRSASETSLKQILVQLRIAIQRYSFAHKGIYPAQVTDGSHPAGSVQSFQRQMRMRTNAEGIVLSQSSEQKGCGPFLHSAIPYCPVGMLQRENTINIVREFGRIQADANPQHAWKYNSQTGEFLCNSNALCVDGSSPYWWW